MVCIRGLLATAVIACGISSANAAYSLSLVPLGSPIVSMGTILVPLGGTQDVQVYLNETDADAGFVNGDGGLYGGTAIVAPDGSNPGTGFSLTATGSPSASFSATAFADPLNALSWTIGNTSSDPVNGVNMDLVGSNYQTLWGTLTFTPIGNAGDTATFTVSDIGDFITNSGTSITPISGDTITLAVVPEPAFLLIGTPVLAALLRRRR